jgi:hypothetical protein
MPHNLFESARIVTVAAGTFINTNAVGGTHLGVAPLGEFEYHSIVFAGTFANNGTINAYAVENTAGSSPRLIASLPVGSGNGQAAVIDIKSDAAGTFGATGTSYGYLAPDHLDLAAHGRNHHARQWPPGLWHTAELRRGR